MSALLVSCDTGVDDAFLRCPVGSEDRPSGHAAIKPLDFDRDARLTSERVRSIAHQIRLDAARACETEDLAQLGALCACALQVSGAGITIMGTTGRSGPVSMSNDRIATLEDIQFTTGDGPSAEAFRLREPVHAPRLDAVAFARWPSFVSLARTTGIGSVSAFPLAARGVTLGVLALYREWPGELNRGQRDDSVAVAKALTESLLDMPAESRDGTLDAVVEQAVMYRAEVYQASGMVAIQLNIPVDEALTRIRAYAFSIGEDLTALAARIVARQLRLSDDRRHPSDDW